VGLLQARARTGAIAMNELLKRFVADENGLETIEYAIMTALILGGVLAVVGAVALLLQGKYQLVENELTLS
jgi:Flp pilus assembly pilin Flp